MWLDIRGNFRIEVKSWEVNVNHLFHQKKLAMRIKHIKRINSKKQGSLKYSFIAVLKVFYAYGLPCLFRLLTSRIESLFGRVLGLAFCHPPFFKSIFKTLIPLPSISNV